MFRRKRPTKAEREAALRSRAELRAIVRATYWHPQVKSGFRRLTPVPLNVKFVVKRDDQAE